METFARLRQLVHDVTGLPEELITPESTADQLHMDTLDIAELVMCVEEEFDIFIEDDTIHSMGDLMQCVPA